MALSNMLREPRREITESVVGIAFLALVIGGFARFGMWFANRTTDANNPYGPMVFVGMLVALVSIFVLIALAYFTHFVGEEVCDKLKKHGLELRPKERAETRERRAAYIKQCGLERAKATWPELFAVNK